MANTFSMNISNGSHQLVWIKLHDNIWHLLLHLMELFHHSICCVRDVVHYNVKIYLVWLVSISIETLSHLNAIRMMQHFQNSQFSIFIPFVLEYLLDSHCFSSFGNGCLEYNTEWSISNNFLSIISHALKYIVLDWNIFQLLTCCFLPPLVCWSSSSYKNSKIRNHQQIKFDLSNLVKLHNSTKLSITFGSTQLFSLLHRAFIKLICYSRKRGSCVWVIWKGIFSYHFDLSSN